MNACCPTATPELGECSNKFNEGRLLPLRCSCKDLTFGGYTRSTATAT